MTLLLVATLSVSFSSCKNDDEPVILDDYIIGSWHSFKGVVTASGKSETIDISKTGDYSLAYIEVDFLNGGQAICRGWDMDSNGLVTWVEERCTYSTNNDIVTMTSPEGETVSLVFDNNKTLCYKTITTIYGSAVMMSVYLKK